MHPFPFEFFRQEIIDNTKRRILLIFFALFIARPQIEYHFSFQIYLLIMRPISINEVSLVERMGMCRIKSS